VEQLSALGIGMVGYGYMGRLHTLNWKALPHLYHDVPFRPVLAGVLTSRADSAARAAHDAGFGFATTDLDELIGHPQVQLIDITGPNSTHIDSFLMAAAAGKHIYCEKPLAADLAQARQMAKAGKLAAGKIQMVFHMRFIPAIQRARQLVTEGLIGDPLIFRARYLHASYLDPQKPMTWRQSPVLSGGGALVDLGSHIIDMMRFLVGDFRRVFARMQTFINERPAGDGSGRMLPVEVDDHAQLVVELVNGGTGTIEASRVGTGSSDDLQFEIHGSRGALGFSLLNSNVLRFYDLTRPDEPIGGLRGFTEIQTVSRYPGIALPGERAVTGFNRWHADCQMNFLRAIASGRDPSPSLEDGYRVQEIMEAAYRSARAGTWVDLPL
jgi:predicted dehydrogenase